MKSLTRKRFFITIVFLAVLSFLVCAWALMTGIHSLSFRDVLDAVFSNGNANTLSRTIIVDVRFPRVALAFLVGMGLSIAGAVLQALLRNPLAEPHLIGVSSGAALGGVIAALFLSALPFLAQFSMPASSFAGALAAITLIYLLSQRKGVLSVYTLLLVGVILNSFFISIIIFIQSIVRADELASIFSWLLGSLSYIKHDMLIVTASVICITGGALFLLAPQFNLLSLGETRAESLGVNVEKTKRIAFVLTSLMVGVMVSVSGLIGFIGLVVPHIARLLFGSDHRIVIPASACIGGTLLVAADTLARTIIAPQEIPVGVITAFLGAPFFIILLKRKEMKRVF